MSTSFVSPCPLHSLGVQIGIASSVISCLCVDFEVPRVVHSERHLCIADAAAHELLSPSLSARASLGHLPLTSLINEALSPTEPLLLWLCFFFLSFFFFTRYSRCASQTVSETPRRSSVCGVSQTSPDTDDQSKFEHEQKLVSLLGVMQRKTRRVLLHATKSCSG